MAASTPRQIMLRKAGEALSPDKSVANLNALAQVLLANVAIVGTVLTVLGAFTDIGDQFVDHPWLVLVPLILVVVAVIAALVALAPQPIKFNPANITQIDHIYAQSIQRKLVSVLIGFAALGFAIIAAGVPAFADALDDEDVTAQLSVGFNTVLGNTGVNEVAQATAKMQHLPEQAVVDVKITDGPAENATLLASRRVIAGSSGEVDLTFDTSTGKELKSATLIVLVTKDGEQLFSRKVTRE